MINTLTNITKKTFPIGLATTSSTAVNRISLLLARTTSVLQLTAKAAGIWYTFGKGTNASPITSLSASQVEVVAGLEYLLPLTSAADIEAGMTLTIKESGGSTIRGRCIAEAIRNPLKSGSGNNTLSVRGSLSGGVSTDEVLFMDPVVNAVGAYLASGQSVILNRPSWANYLYFVREASTDATAIITEVD